MHRRCIIAREGAKGPCCRTTTVAFMLAWMEQWYGNVPALVNVKLKTAPGARSPLENELSSAVTVCVVESSLVQVT